MSPQTSTSVAKRKILSDKEFYVGLFYGSKVIDKDYL